MSDPQQPPYAPAPQPAVTERNTPGRAGFIVGLVSLGISLLTTLFAQIILHGADGMLLNDASYAMITVVGGVGGFLSFAAALAALILGLIGLRKTGVPHAYAGIATGLGIAGVFGGIVSFLIAVTSPFMY